MSAAPAVLLNSMGHNIRVGRELGKGGEGAVYEAQDQHDYAIKLYWPNKAAERRDKVSAMVAAAWFKSNAFVAFPIDVLYGPNGSFVGFVMRRVGGHKPVHLLYSPSSRKVEFGASNFRFLVHAAANAARAVASVHSTNCVIGDVNHSGFLVSDKATITLIDSDSFQVAASGKNFLCQVGTPEYTPPELHGSRFDRVARARNHDNFGLAVLIFQLLFMGRHPYSGRFLGSGDMPLERAIAEFRFAYSAQKSATGMEPPPNVPLLSDFPDYIGAAFEKAFGRAGVQERPRAEMWVTSLERLAAELQECQANAAHHHVKGKPCPWCRMERANPGFVAFLSSQPLRVVPLHIDTAQMAALIRSISDPGSTPDINQVLSVPGTITPAGLSSPLMLSWRRQVGGGLAASVVGLLLLNAGGPAAIALLLCAAGAAGSFYPNASMKSIADRKRQSETAWRGAREAWGRQPGNAKYAEARRDAETTLRSLEGLPAEERNGLQQLEQRKREVQLARFLERFQLSAAKIPKIGSGRKAVLASFGVETAADIEHNRLESIQGFGPTLISSLMTWRKALEQKFVFNPHEPTNPADIARLKATLASKKADLERRFRTAVASLQQAAHLALDQRKALLASANAAFANYKQAEADERLIHPILTRVAKIVSSVCLVLALFGLGSTQKKQPTQSAVTQSAPPPQIVIQQKSTFESPKQQSGQRLPPPPPPAIPKDLAPPIRSEAGPVGTTTMLPTVQATDATAPKTENSAALPAPALPLQQPAPLDDQPKLDVYRGTDALRIQQRLAELGFLLEPPDGKWGSRSARALQEFRAANGLDASPTWDAGAEVRLFSFEAARAARLTFAGAWTTEAGACGDSREGPPLRITNSQAETAGGRCIFDSVRVESEGTWRVRARCTVNGTTWSANIQLRLMGDRLIWTSEKGRAQYFRCAN